MLYQVSTALVAPGVTSREAMRERSKVLGEQVDVGVPVGVGARSGRNPARS